MTESFEGQLVRRRLPIAVVIGIAALAVAMLVVIGFIVFGDDGDRPPTDGERKALAAKECPRVKDAHFYRIEKNGKASYLLGTRHAGVALAKYPKVVAEAFSAATVLVTETTFPESNETRTVQTVEATLGPKLWTKYKSIVGDDASKRVNPLGVQAATAQLILLYEDITQSIDLELVRRARKEGKHLVGLEDPAEGEHVAEADDLGNIYLGKQTLELALRQTYRRTVIERETRRTLRSYCNGGRSRMQVLEDVTNDRTRSWVAALVPLLEAGGVFIAVGSVHVDQGSLDLGALLEEQGFIVRAVQVRSTE